MLDRWSEPPQVPSPTEIMAIEDPVERADAAHLAIRDLADYQQWLVRARGEAIAAAYAREVPYAALGQRWGGISGERVRQMMFQSRDARSGWLAAKDLGGGKPDRITRGANDAARFSPFGIVHAMRSYEETAACGVSPVTSLGADFTGTIYPTCEACRDKVKADLGET